MVQADGVEIADRLTLGDGRSLVYAIRKLLRGGATEEVIPDVVQVVRAQMGDVIVRAKLSQLLPTKPDEAQLVRRSYVLHLLGDVEDGRRTRRVVQHSLAVNRIEVGIDDNHVVWVAAFRLGDDVVVGSVILLDRRDAEAHRRWRWRRVRREAVVRVIEVVADGEGSERDRNRRNDRVAVGVDEAP